MNPFQELLNTLNAPKILGALPQLTGLMPSPTALKHSPTAANLFGAFTGGSLNLNDVNNTGSATINPLAGGMNLSFGNGFGVDVNARNKEIGLQTPIGALSGNFTKDNPGAKVALPLGKTGDVEAGYDRTQGAFGKINFNIPFGGNQQSFGGRLPTAPIVSNRPSVETVSAPSTGRYLPEKQIFHLLPKEQPSSPDQQFLEDYINKRR